VAYGGVLCFPFFQLMFVYRYQLSVCYPITPHLKKV